MASQRVAHLVWRRRGQASQAERFRAGVGAVIFSGGRVLAFERRDVAGAWQLPQGAIDHDEPIDAALFREIEEETGITRDHLKKRGEAPIWMGYELPPRLRGSKTGRGQVHRWFFLELIGDDNAITLKKSKEFSGWAWRDLQDLAESTVEFRRPVYRELARIAAVMMRT